LNRAGLALHDRHGGIRPDVAEAEHRRAVGDHGDGVALDREAAGVLGVFGDGQAHPRHAGGVGAGELVAVAQGDLRRDLDLAAEVQQEGPVGDLAHVDAVELLEAGDDLLGVGGVGVSQVRSTTTVVLSESTTSTAVTIPPASPTEVVRRADRRGIGDDGDTDGDGKPALGSLCEAGVTGLFSPSGSPPPRSGC